ALVGGQAPVCTLALQARGDADQPNGRDVRSVKEQLHEIPLDYTWVEGVSDKSRHRLAGTGECYRDAPHFNGWRPSGVKPRPGDRPQVMQDLSDLAWGWRARAAAWVGARAAHVKAVYATPDKDTPAGLAFGPDQAGPGTAGMAAASLLPTSTGSTAWSPPPGDIFAPLSKRTRQARSEDWHHNATVQASDVRSPSARLAQQGETVRLWRHDLLNAYRQWPARDCFGAAASVWNFNGAGDALQFLTRTLLFLVGGHYVDDFNGVDATDLADSAFHGFADFFLLMGLNTKASKAQEPGRSHVVQLSLGRDGATLAPTERWGGRRWRPFTPDLAPTRCNKSELPPGLQAALLAIAALLEQVRHKAGWVPANAPMAHHHRSANGWGYVVRVGDTAWYDSGSVPAWFVRKFGARRAYIYMLEVLAQILAVVTLADALGEDWVAFIDNAAGQWAFNKGYGRDPSVNDLLSAFWSLAAMHSWRPTFHRVTSEANIADPISWADCTIA
ncbi:unnamed protein product, partial [Symbiodinium pilosum]